MATPKKKDSITKTVNTMISSLTLPYRSEITSQQNQMAGQIKRDQAFDTTYGGLLSSAQARAKVDLGQALNDAAKYSGLSESAQREYANSLRRMMGGVTDSSAAGALSPAAARLGIGNSDLVRQLRDNGVLGSRLLSEVRAVGGAATRERKQAVTANANDRIRDLKNQIQAVHQRRPEFINQIKAQQAELENMRLQSQIAAQEFGLKAANYESLDAYRQGQLGIAQQNANTNAYRAANEAKGKKMTAKEKAEAVSSVWGSLWTKKGVVTAPKTPWRSSFTMLTNKGLGANYAALIASKWTGQHSYNSTFAPSTPANAFTKMKSVYNMMRSRGVDRATAQQIMRQQYGSREPYGPHVWEGWK